MRKSLLQTAGVFACLVFLSACGGGGGGSPTPTPTPSPTPTPTSRIPVLPDLLEFSLIEGPVNNGGGSVSFTVIVDDTTLPANLSLNGQDAANFGVSIQLSAPNASGQANVEVALSTLTERDFEKPTDANGDNIYEFTISMTYKGVALSTDIAATVLDVPEANVMRGEYWKQSFGNPMLGLPDLTGDGTGEIGVSIVSGEGGTAAGYILTGETLETQTGSVRSISDYGTRITETIPGDPRTANLLTGMDSPEGSGVDLLFSEGSQDRAVLIPGLTPSEYANLRGSIDLDSITDKVTYAFPSTGKYEARLIGDLNNDDKNDILVRGADGNGDSVFGIILGRDVASDADRSRDLTFDLTLQTDAQVVPRDYDSEIGYYLKNFDVTLLPDLTGDGIKEILYTYSGTNPSNFQPEDYLVYVRSAGYPTFPTVVNVDNLSSANGWAQSLRSYASIGLTADYDGDGYPTLYAAADGWLYMIDTDDLNTSDLSQIDTAFGPTSGRISRSGIALGDLANDIGDIDGDGIPEIGIGNRPRLDVTLVKGSVLKNVLDNQLDYVLEAGDSVGADFTRVLGYPQSQAERPVRFSDGSVALGFVARNSTTNSPDQSGAVVSLGTDIISEAFAEGEAEIDLIEGQ